MENLCLLLEFFLQYMNIHFGIYLQRNISTKVWNIWSMWHLTRLLSVLPDNNLFFKKFWVSKQNQLEFISVSLDNPTYTFIYLICKIIYFNECPNLWKLYMLIHDICIKFNRRLTNLSHYLYLIPNMLQDYFNYLGLNYTSDILKVFYCLDSN